MNNMLERAKSAKSKFISYYERGATDPKWYRSNFMYFYWSVCKDDTSLDDELITLWSHVSLIFEIEDNAYTSTYDAMLYHFDLMERVAKMWSFS